MSLRGQELERKKLWMEHVYAPSTDSPEQAINTAATEPAALPCFRTAAKARRILPSFFVIGPPRTGTTWIYQILSQHALLPSPTKETRFFDTHFHRGLDWYSSHFRAPVAGRIVGEVAPTYFASTKASERIAGLLPEARVVCIFRNPVERVVSLYKLKCAYGLIPWSFEEAIVRDPELLESGRYATKLHAWQSALGRDQVMGLLYEDLRKEPQGFLDSLVDFIGVPRFALKESDAENVNGSDLMTHPRSYRRARNASSMADWFKARRLDRVVAAVRNSPLKKFFVGGGAPFAELPQEIVDHLYELFRPEVASLENLIDRDLSGWKSMSRETA